MWQKKFNPILTFFCCLLALVIGFIAAFAVYTYLQKPHGGDVYVSGDLQIHFLELGNKYTGDCVYIKAGETDILIDAGSRTNSVGTIDSYLQEQMNGDRTLEYVIVTHSDRDHIACFAGDNSNDSLFDLYECETIIDFPRTNQYSKSGGPSATFERYIEKRDAEQEAGAKHYTALDCWKELDGAQKVYELSSGIEMEILYNYYYENDSADENNYSVCIMLNQGDKHFLLTGDLEEDGEEKLVEYNDLPEVELFKAGHHGSKTSSNDCLLSVIKPKIVCVCCCAGTDEYSDTPENQFPTQAMIDRVSVYTEDVYVTSLGDESAPNGFVSMNGNIVVTSNRSGVTVEGSNNNTLLKDTLWFKENRSCPEKWR